MQRQVVFVAAIEVAEQKEAPFATVEYDTIFDEKVLSACSRARVEINWRVSSDPARLITESTSNRSLPCSTNQPVREC